VLAERSRLGETAVDNFVPELSDAKNITAFAIAFAEWLGARRLSWRAVGAVGR
jgi:hypothetical protein